MPEEHYHFDVAAGKTPQRIDQFVTAALSQTSRSHVRKLIDDGRILVGGKQVKASYLIAPLDKIDVTIPVPVPFEATPQDIPLDIMYQDEEIAVEVHEEGEECDHDHEIDDTQLTGETADAISFLKESAWKIELTGLTDMPIVELQNQALSVSGIVIQGSHVVSPRQTEFTHYAHSRVRVIHEEAAYADAWSTACLLMTENELENAKDRITIYCS